MGKPLRHPSSIPTTTRPRPPVPDHANTLHWRMSESDKPLREQIDDGMQAIRHQIERLREGPTMGDPSDDRSLIADLEAEYQALKAARVGLGPNDRPP